eukprot:m.417326 g.417326  ORF g.417326 m.417326 type:complete len:285 (-) comp30379_c0_seq1:153-1007(-)
MWARCGLRVSQQPSFRVAVPAHCTPALQQLRGVREMAEPMVDAEGIATSIAEVNANIAAAFGRASVPPPRLPRLVAVSKTKPLAAIAAAYAAGQRCFGENYVQELVEKANDPASPHDIQWHFIGTLQSNKAKIVAAVPNLAMIETVTSMKLAKLLEKAVAGSDRATPLAVMVQLNTSGEENKGGVEPDQCSGVVSAILKECPHLKFAGLMTIGQYGRVTAAGEVNPDFALLVKSRDELCEALGLDAADVEVSMGMSGDYEHAIEVGSTNVRVGSSIFGAREKKP